MKYTKITSLLVLILVVLLVACGGGDETSNEDGGGGEQPEATAVADDTTSDDAGTDNAGADEPAVELGEETRVDEGGYAFRAPAGFDASVDYIFAELSDPNNADTQIGLVGTPLEEGMTLDTMYEGFASEFSNDETVTLGERQPFSVNGLDGFSVTMEGDEDGKTMKGKMVVVGNETQAVFIFGGSEDSVWDGTLSEQFDAIIDSLSLFAPVTEEASVDAPVAEDTTDAPAEETTDAPAEDPAPEPTAEPADTSDAAPVSVGSTEPGFACFGTSGDGMNCLTAAGEWQLFNQSNSELGSDFISGMGVCADGTLLVATSDGVTAYDGNTFQNMEGGWGYASPEAIACAADGAMWVAHFGGVSHYDGTGWKTYESAEHLATGDQASDLVNDIMIDGNGNIWVVTSNAIAMFDGTDWTRYQVGEGLTDKYFFDQLVLDSAGLPWALHSSGLLQFDGNEWINHKNSDFFSAEAAVVDNNGLTWLGTYSNGLYTFDGSSWTETNTSNSDLSDDGVRSLAIDNNGRLYVGTVYGLNVYDGTSWTIYNMDSADMVSHNIDSIAVVNGGPTLPAVMDKENGSVTGSFSEDGSPLAEAAVELCVRELYSSYSGDTPCADQSNYYTTTTNSDGTFSFDDIPVGIYFIVFETDTGWGKLTDDFGIGSEEIPVVSGEATDIGEVTLAAE